MAEARRRVGFLTACAVALLAAADRLEAQTTEQPSAAPPAATSAVRPLEEVVPILQRRCLSCHNQQQHSGGLRLDNPDSARLGGDSGLLILGGRLETNELYRRVSSADRTYRMPKNAQPLEADEIETIKKWVEQGTPWPGEMAATTIERPFYREWPQRLQAFALDHQQEVNRLKPFVATFVLGQVVILLVARAKTAHRLGRRWTRGRLAAFCRFASNVTGREFLLAWMLLVSALVVAVVWTHDRRLASDLEKARLARGKQESSWAHTVFGYPPVPVRPDHAKQLAGTYYRGNCERHVQLFNGGNYLTAIFRVALCDRQHHRLHAGDPLPTGPLVVRFELERAPGTTDALFSKSMMEGAFLTQVFYDEISPDLKDDPVHLTAVKDDWLWEAYVPIGSPDEDGRLQGLIYLFTGGIKNGQVHGSPHNGIKYDLVVRDGKLSADSDLWMGSFGGLSIAAPEPSGKIPFREWFDYRPIPAITGENSSDPKLLGIEEYLRKGLIPPQPADDPKADPEGEATPAEPKSEQEPSRP